jgi:hypothetical protein
MDVNPPAALRKIAPPMPTAILTIISTEWPREVEVSLVANLSRQRPISHDLTLLWLLSVSVSTVHTVDIMSILCTSCHNQPSGLGSTAPRRVTAGPWQFGAALDNTIPLPIQVLWPRGVTQALQASRRGAHLIARPARVARAATPMEDR